MCGFEQIENLFTRFPELEIQKDNICRVIDILTYCFEQGGKLLVAGNGGSAADSEHIEAELMKGFENKRIVPPEYTTELCKIDKKMGVELSKNLQGALPTIALSGHSAFATAYGNDCNSVMSYAQLVYGLGKNKDVLWAISTSGNSENIIYAAIAAKAKGMKVIGLTGNNDSRLSDIADVTIRSSYSKTYMIQEHHLPIYHCICLILEEKFFGKDF